MQVSTSRRVVIQIQGIGYGPAVQRIEHELARVPGVTNVSLLPGRGTATVTCASTTGESSLVETVRRLGFRAELAAA